MNDPSTTIDAPERLLHALDEGRRRGALPDDVKLIVDRALRARTWLTLVAASRVLRLEQAGAREDGLPVPDVVVTKLAEVRAAMAELRGRTKEAR